MSKISRRLYAKLSIGIALLAVPIFVLALGVLFLYSRHIIQQETTKQATSMLHFTTQGIRSNMGLVENAINSNSWLLEENFQPDSLASVCRRIATLNRTISNCHVITNPDEMAQIEQGFSISVAEKGDTTVTYAKALHADSTTLGIVTASLPYKEIATLLNKSKRPSPNAFYLLTKKDQQYSDANSLVFSHDLPDTNWQVVLVCPKSEMLKSYHQLLMLTTGLLVVGLLLILLICYLLTKKTVKPLNQLLTLSKAIMAGQYDKTIPQSAREDVIGRLQNSFSIMQQSLITYVGNIQNTAMETKKHNKELAKAMKLAEQSAKNKELFIQNVLHQIRTPLNIVMGFADVLGDSIKSHHNDDSQPQLQKEELAEITDTMTHNAIHLNRMVLMLYDSSEYGNTDERPYRRKDYVSCNLIAKECIDYTRERFPKTTISFESDLTDGITILSSNLAMMRTLRELLFNAAKYSDGQHITLRITETATTIRFTVEDIGPGIAPEAKEFIFKPFTKVDDLSEGLGLGLPLAKRHAVRLGGNLFYDDSYHEGCRFILEMPK